MQKEALVKQLRSLSTKFRLKILKTIYNAGKGHIGGAYSCVDILTVLYYGGFLGLNKKNYLSQDRNRFLLSKGHAAIAQYVILQELGLITEKDLMSMNNEGLLGEHPDHNIPGIEFDTGSLGHGLGVASGMAYSAKLDNKNCKTYVVLGDGECCEGTIWEAAQLSAHLSLNNLIAIVDRNGLCIHGQTEKINRLNPFGDKWRAFGWNVVEVDGHDHKKLFEVFSAIGGDKPTVIIANTTKGKGVSFMENNHKWHHGGIDKDTYHLCKEEISRGTQ
mgnify:CR=1 FL=1|tara:strand:+ start:8091 stop:8915 length:825 start_codon:yes stop_codon:yes gene_type:complete